MSDTIWCFEQKEKSLECISRDFFASGTKTLVLVPQQEKLLKNEAFAAYVGQVLQELQQLGQEITVIGAGSWPCVTATRNNSQFVFENMPMFKARRRNLLGKLSTQEDVPPALPKVGLCDKLVECDNVVLVSHLHRSSRFGVSGLMSLVENILPTYTLSQVYMLNQSGAMIRSLTEIVAAKIFPKVALSILWNENGIVMGKDMVAVESVALRNASMNLRDDRLILESVKLDLGDILIQQSFVSGGFVGRKPAKYARINSKPIWKKEFCNLCLDCLDSCPNGALTKKDKTVAISSNCIKCGACIDFCNYDALI